MFADAPANTLTECSSLKNDLTAISYWASRWQLKLNPTKCEALMIANKRKPIPFTYSIKHRSNPVKYLGVQVDSKLNWSKHCKFVVSKGTKLQSYGIPIIWEISNYQSPYKSVQLDGSVGVAGVHLPALGPFLRMIVAPNFTFLLSSQDKVSFRSVSSMTYITSKHLTLNSHCSFNSITSTRSHHLSLVPPQSTINSR